MGIRCNAMKDMPYLLSGFQSHLQQFVIHVHDEIVRVDHRRTHVNSQQKVLTTRPIELVKLTNKSAC